MVFVVVGDGVITLYISLFNVKVSTFSGCFGDGPTDIDFGVGLSWISIIELPPSVDVIVSTETAVSSCNCCGGCCGDGVIGADLGDVCWAILRNLALAASKSISLRDLFKFGVDGYLFDVGVNDNFVFLMIEFESTTSLSFSFTNVISGKSKNDLGAFSEYGEVSHDDDCVDTWRKVNCGGIGDASRWTRFEFGNGDLRRFISIRFSLVRFSEYKFFFESSWELYHIYLYFCLFVRKFACLFVRSW